MQYNKFYFKALWISMILVATSCSIVHPVKIDSIVKYDIAINYSIDYSKINNYHNMCFTLKPTVALPPYNNKYIYYLTNKYELNHYNYSQWSIKPSNIIDNMLLINLPLNCISSNNSLRSKNYQLETTLLELQSNVDNKDVNLIILAKLTNLNKSFVKQKIFIESTTIAVNPNNIAYGTKKNLQQFMLDLHLWLISIAPI